MTQHELSYDFEDFGLSQKELEAKYIETGEHLEYTITKWRNGPSDESPGYNGYWDWVMQSIEKDDEEIPSNVANA
jgi:hypothetical protein